MRKSVKTGGQEMVEQDYSTLVARVRAHIDEVYGGVAGFVKHEDFTKCGFVLGKDDPNMYIYLSIAKEGNEGLKRVRSFPMIKKLYKGLFNEELESKIKVERTQVILGPTTTL